MKSLLKDKIRLTYGFDIEILKPNTKLLRMYSNGHKEFVWVKECSVDRIWLMNENGICVLSHDCFSADEYYKNKDIEIYLVK